MIRRTNIALGAALAATVLACGPRALAQDRAAPTVLELAKGDGRFRTLVAAVEAAGLAADLSGEGPFTVFAPTDEAFAALPAGTVDRLLARPQELRRVLLHHVARGRRPAAEVVEYDAVQTLAGTTLKIDARGGTVRIGEGRVVIADLRARNGVVHVVDRVLLPPPAAGGGSDLAEVARSAGTFGTLLAAAQAAGLADALAGPGPLTVFAPTDAAFAVLPGDALKALLADEAALRRLLSHHIVAGSLGAAEVATRGSLTTLAGTQLAVDARQGVLVGGARVVKADIVARNGVIHVIDRVLLPPARDDRAAAAPACSGRFPALEARNLEGRRFRLPGDLDGERNLCLIAFQRWQQREVDTWLRALPASRVGDLAGFAWWEFPTIWPRGEAMQRFVDGGMRAGIPDRAARERTITLWTDVQAFRDALELPTERTIQVVLIDRAGRVLWRTEGAWTPEKGAALERALGLPGA